MKLRVEITDDIEDFEFSEETIFIGSSDDCHITLPYEGVASAHLEISHEEDRYFISELGSGEKTFVNGELISPSSRFEFNSFFPVEIGGILIYLVDESVEGSEELDESLNRISQDITSSINLDKLNLVDVDSKESTEIERDTIPGERKYLEEKVNLGTLSETAGALSEFAESEIIDPLDALEREIEQSEINTREQNNFERERFKHEIMAPSSGTSSGTGSQSFKIKVPTTRTSTKVSVNKKEQKQRPFRNKITRKPKSNSLGPILILSLVLVITGGIYYFEYYKKELKETAITKSPKKKEYDLSIGSNMRFSKFESKYDYFINEPKCLKSIEKLMCRRIGASEGAGLAEYEGAKVIADTLFIGVRQKSLNRFLSTQMALNEIEVKKLKEIVEEKYSKFFSFEEFEKNESKATFEAYKFNYEQYLGVSLAGFLVYNTDLLKILNTEPKVKRVHFFTFDEFKKQVRVKSFIDFSKEMYQLSQSNIPKNLFEIKLQVNHFLNEGIESFYNTKFSTHLGAFDPQKLEEFKKIKKQKHFLGFLQKPVCFGEGEGELCQILKSSRENNTEDGVIISDDTLYVAINSELTTKLRKDLYLKKEFSSFERKKLLKASYANISKFDKNKFFKNDFIYDSIAQGELELNKLMSEFVNSGLISEVLKRNNLKKVVLLGFKYSSNGGKALTALIEMNSNALQASDIGTTKELTTFLWRSKIPSFNKFIKRKAIDAKSFIETKEFSKTQ